MAPLASFMPGKEKKCVLKIDIEGFEYSLIDQIAGVMRDHNCPCHFSLHPNLLFKQMSGKTYDYFSRIRAWKRTIDLIGKISDTHEVFFEDNRPVTSVGVFALACRPRYTRAFSIICLPKSS